MGTNIMSGGRASEIVLLFSIVVLFVIIPGCGGNKGDDFSPEDLKLLSLFDLTGVPLSDELAPFIKASHERLALPDIKSAVTDDIDLFFDFRLRLARPDEREEQSQKLIRLWESDGNNTLWINTLIAYNVSHGMFTDQMAQLKRLADSPDSSSLTWLYVRHYQNSLQGDNEKEILELWDRRAELDSLALFRVATGVAGWKIKSGNAIDAVEFLLPLLARSHEHGGYRLELALWDLIAAALLDGNRLDDALAAASIGMELATKAGYPYMQTDFLTKLGDILESRHEYDAALLVFEEARQFSETKAVTHLIGTTTDRIASLYSLLGMPEKALEYDRRNVKHLIATSDIENLPRILICVADDFRLMGEMDSSFVYVKQARAIVDASDNAANRARLPFQEAEYYTQIGDYQTADSLLAIANARAPGVVDEIDRARLLIGQIDQGQQLGHPLRAYRAIERLRKINPVLHDHQYDLRTKYHVATAYFLAQQGEIKLATESLDQAEETSADAGGVEDKFIYNLCKGQIALQRGDFFTAEVAFEKCITIADESHHIEWREDARFHLAKALLNQRKFDACLDLISTNIASARYGGNYRTRLSMYILKAITLSRAGRYQEALSAFENAVALSNPRSPADVMVLLETELGRCLNKLGRIIEAEQQYLNADERLRKHSIAGNIPGLRAFIDNQLYDVTEGLIEIYSDNSDPNNREDAAWKSLQRYEFYLTNAHRSSTAPVTRQQLRTALSGTSTPIMAFFAGRLCSFMWMIHGKHIELHKLPPIDQLRKLIDPISADMKNPLRPICEAEIDELSRLLLAPLEDRWQEKSTLHIIPHGVINRVPLQILRLPSESPGTPQKTVIEQGPVRTVPSISSLALTGGRAGKRTHLSLLAIGHNGSAGSLRHAEAEAKDIVNQWPWQPTVLRIGSNARWLDLSALPLGSFDVIHLASHIRIHYGAEGEIVAHLSNHPDDDPLTPAQLAEFDFSASLVFLSCCEGAAVDNGNGLVNFAQAFLNNGVISVIASTQKIDDEAARQIATQFYKNWHHGESKAEALRSAQLFVRAAKQEWNHPYYWAPYVIIGSGE
jgi:CHAT domain-containing protein/tetratricopeptide (TPR) repeat protein